MEPMSSASHVLGPVVKAGSHLTLHYRVSLADAGTDVINTFGDRPATFQVGVGQMAEALERCLLGLAEGERRAFELSPEQAFGERNPELVQKLARQSFDANVDGAEEYRAGDVIDIAGPDGGRVAGVLKELTERYALFDFNHPLAGQRLRFEVHILGVL
jgi:FKBP-type peptidyl-prolyl cis-trans isomerase SlpA